MKRLLIPALGVAALLLGSPALAAAPQTTVAGRFTSEIAAIKRDARAPAILLPSSMPIGFAGPADRAHPRLYPGGGPSGNGYGLYLGAVKNCDGVDACNVASFSAQKGGQIANTFTAVKVPGASQARYHGLLCGGSCSPPEIAYVVHGVIYSIEANVTVSNDKAEAVLIAAAESSIKAGPR